ncbi:Mur ligase family protein, partial [Escherichia coli]
GVSWEGVVVVGGGVAVGWGGFGSLVGVEKAKGAIFSGLQENGLAIMNADNNDWLNWQSVIGSRKVWRF